MSTKLPLIEELAAASRTAGHGRADPGGAIEIKTPVFRRNYPKVFKEHKTLAYGEKIRNYQVKSFKVPKPLPILEINLRTPLGASGVFCSASCFFS